MSLELKDKTAYRNDITTNTGVVEVANVPATLTGAVYSAELGVGDSLVVLDSNSLDFTTEFTIEGWVWSSATDGPGVICGKAGAPGNRSYNAYFQGDESAILQTFPDGTNQYSRYTNPSQFTLSTWQHWAFVYATDGSIKIYKDAVELSTNLLGTQTNPTAVSTENISINFNGSNGITRFCDLRLWNKARTVTELSNNKNSLLTGNEANLVANWQFQPFERSSGGFFLAAV